MAKTPAPNSIESNQTESEIRAYIYQTLSDLEGVLPQGSSFNVEVKNSKSGHKARIVLNSDLGQFTFEGTSSNVFEAIQRSSEVMKSHIFELSRALHEAEGEGQTSAPATYLLH